MIVNVLENILQIVHSKFSIQIKMVYIAGVFFLGLFLFWRSTKRLHVREAIKVSELTDSRKLFRVGGLFDLVFLCLLFAVFLSRILYIVYMPAEFSGARWFWLPYEKIENNVYIMSSFPWLFLRFWDGGLLIDGFILGLTSSFFFFSKFYSLRWSSVANAAADFLWFIFLSIEAFWAVCDENVFHVVIFIMLLIIGALRFFSNKYKIDKKQSVFTRTVDLLWKTAAFLGAAIVVLWLRLSLQDVSGREFLVAVDATAVAIASWMWVAQALGGFYEKRGVQGGQSANVEEAEVDKMGGELRKKVASETVKVRSFAMSYKDFSGGWAEKLQGLGRLFRKRRDPQNEDSKDGL